MPTISDRPLRRVCVRLWEDNCQTIETISRTTGVSFNQIVREAIRSYATQLRALEQKNLDKISL